MAHRPGTSAALSELRRKIVESLEDPRPNIPAAKVFRELRAHHARRLKRKVKLQSPRTTR